MKRHQNEAPRHQTTARAKPSHVLILLSVFSFACGGIGGPNGTQHATQTAADSADHVMFGMHTIITNLGVKSADLESDTAYMYEQVGRTELKNVKLIFFSAAGVQQSVLTSNEGTYLIRTGTMEARGNVVVVKTDGSRLTTTILRYDQTQNKVSTDQPYTYDSADKHIQGVGFVTDPSLTNITTNRIRGTGGGFTLPGQ